jgi:hypothetical protein
LNVVAVSGSTFLPSRTLVLTQAIVAELGKHLRINSHVIELVDVARPTGAALSRKELCWRPQAGQTPGPRLRFHRVQQGRADAQEEQVGSDS